MNDKPKVIEIQTCPDAVAHLVFTAQENCENGRGAFQWWDFDCGNKAIVVYPKGLLYETVRDMMDHAPQTQSLNSLFPYTVVLQTADHSEARSVQVEGIDADEAIECAVRECETDSGETFDQIGCTILAVYAGHHENLRPL